MRELDRNIVYLDEIGNPLKGRVFFYNKGTTDEKNIFDVDGEPLQNPMFTNNGRLSPQVFLDNGDYTIVWEKYIGNGTMSEDDDEQSWIQEGSCVSLAPKINIEVENDGIPFVASIADLRSYDVELLDENKSVCLLGYYEEGDKPQLVYVWDENDSVTDDNGGTIIKVDGVSVGRFKAVNFGAIDSRIFGVFPKVSTSDVTHGDALQIQVAASIAAEKGTYVYFDSIDDGIGYYPLVSGTYRNIVSLNSNSRFVVLNNGSVNIYQYKDYPFYVYVDDENSATINLYGDYLRSSFNCEQDDSVVWNPTNNYIIDTDEQGGTKYQFKNLNVTFEKESSRNYSFDTCNIDALGKLSSDYSYIFKSMEVTDKWMNDPSVKMTSLLISCSVRFDNFTNIENFIYCKKSNGDSVFDFQGSSIDEFEVSGMKDLQILNATIGNITFSDSFNHSVTFKDCAINSFGDAGLADTITFNDCNVQSSIVANKIYLRDSLINGIGTSTSLSEVIDCIDSTIDGDIHCNDAVLNSCTINGDIYTTRGAQNLNFTIADCIIDGVHHVNAGGANFDGIWRCNTFLALSPIEVINVPNTGVNNVVYSNNGGNAPKTHTLSENGSVVAERTGGVATYNCNTAPVSLFGFGNRRVLITIHIHSELESDNVMATDGTTFSFTKFVQMKGLTQIPSMAIKHYSQEWFEIDTPILLTEFELI